MIEKDILYEKKKKRKRIILLTTLAILFVLSFTSQIVLGRVFTDTDYELVITIRNIQGVLSAVQMLLAVWMVTNSKAGYYVSTGCVGLTLFVSILQIVISRSTNTITSVAMAMASLVIVQMIHSYLTKLEKNEKQLFDMAHTDVLTELPNRRSLKQRMGVLLEDSNIRNHKFAVAMVDLDNFKNINDTVGHDYGDKVLMGIANRWRELMDDNDFMARLGGDEFALLISDYDTLGDLDKHLQEFLNQVSKKFVLKGREFYISASMGVALFPSDSLETSQLLKYADMALYAAKYQGKKRVCYFDSMMDDMMENSVQMENVIRHAIENDAFKLVYQPQYQAKDKKLRGFETLIRLCDTKGKQVSPGEFIPVAEKSSLIIDIDKWVLRNAMLEFKGLLEKNPDVVLSINVSAGHMLEPSFLDDLDIILEETGFPTKNLELELTESVFVDSLDKAKEVMFKIKERGIQIALDDFGTGYSSLSYLRELPIDLLKIDKAFVDSIKDGPKEESFVAAIISLSQLMQFAVISEGVEEEYQLNTLRTLGCDYIQGFLWGRPQLLSDIEQLLS